MLSMRSKTILLFMIEKEGGIIFLFLGFFFSFSLIFRQNFFSSRIQREGHEMDRKKEW